MATRPTTELGHSGYTLPSWSALSGGNQGEDAPALMWPASVTTYHRMRSDSQIDALLRSITMPIRRKKWGIDPNGARDEVVEKVAADLGLPILGTDEVPVRPRRRFSHDDHLRHSLLALAYGHMFFEQVGYIDGDLDWRLRKLAPRMPQSITEILVADDGGLAGIKQHSKRATWQGQEIPVDRLVAYPWEREGANWAGRSMLRSAYRHWLIKDRLVRVDAMKNERFGMGIPTGKAPPGGRPDEYGQMAQSIRAGTETGVGLPAGADIGVEGIRGTLPDTIASIRYHDEAMARSFLAMFVQLGQTETGSRALGEAFIDFFELSIEAVSTWYATLTSEHVVEDWVDWNYGPDEQAPLVSWVHDETEPLAISDLVRLVETGVLAVDDELESWVRDRHNLPEQGDNPRPVPLQIAARRRTAAARKQTLNDPTIGHRDPLAHEVAAQTDFEQMQRVWQGATEDIVAEWDTVRRAQIDALVDQVRNAVAAGNTAALASVSAPVLGAELLTERMMEMTEDAITAARAEALAQGVTIDLIDVNELEPLIRARANGVAALMARSISDAAARNAIQRYGADNLDADVVADGVREHLEDLSDAYLNDQLGGALTQAQNTGRRAVMSQRPATYYASELLDQNTCERCAAVDGREYETLAAAEADYPTGGHAECLGGPRCRGTLVAIYDEAEPSV